MHYFKYCIDFSKFLFVKSDKGFKLSIFQKDKFVLFCGNILDSLEGFKKNPDLPTHIFQTCYSKHNFVFWPNLQTVVRDAPYWFDVRLHCLAHVIFCRRLICVLRRITFLQRIQINTLLVYTQYLFAKVTSRKTEWMKAKQKNQYLSFIAIILL